MSEKPDWIDDPNLTKEQIMEKFESLEPVQTIGLEEYARRAVKENYLLRQMVKSQAEHSKAMFEVLEQLIELRKND